MVDLEVYRQAGRMLLDGRRPVQPARLAALPLSRRWPRCWRSRWRCCHRAVEVAWTIGGVLAILAMLHRFGLGGTGLAWSATAVMFVGAGQPDPGLRPGRHLPGRAGHARPRPRPADPARPALLPAGCWTGLAAAVKLTPAMFWLLLLGAGASRAPRRAAHRLRRGLTLVRRSSSPRHSLDFWGRFAHGDTGLGDSFVYFTNQSVMADVVRVLGIGRPSQLLALAACGAWPCSASGSACSGTGAG